MVAVFGAETQALSVNRGESQTVGVMKSAYDVSNSWGGIDILSIHLRTSLEAPKAGSHRPAGQVPEDCYDGSVAYRAANTPAGPKENRNRSPGTSEKMRIRTIATNALDLQAYARTHYVQMGKLVSHGSKRKQAQAYRTHILHILLRNPPLFH